MTRLAAEASPADAVALQVTGLTVGLQNSDTIVEDVDLQVARGEILGIVGESGSGKTTTALALLGYSVEGVERRSGALELAGVSLLMDESMRGVRGAEISYVPQDPSAALNPSLRIAAAIEDVFRAHSDSTEDIATRMLSTVGLPSTPEFARRFPHQISGGQQQRLSIALALCCGPAVVVLDEPTTGLDVVTQANILEELRRLRDEKGIAMVYVSHDLGVVAEIADRIAVMYAGRIVEQGRADLVLGRPRHPYTRGLLASIPDHLQPRVLEPMPGIAAGVGDRPAGCSFAPRCPQRIDRCVAEPPELERTTAGHQVRCFRWRQTQRVKMLPLERPGQRADVPGPPLLTVDSLCADHRVRREVVSVARGVSFKVPRGTCVALVGESGSGKTTIARSIAGLHPPASGSILLGDEDLSALSRQRSIAQRRRIQIILQGQSDALNPRHTVRATIGRPARRLRGLSRSAAAAEVVQLLEKVRLPGRTADRYPWELSGGERQRVAIARALAAGPELILCDEITSALDVSVQAAVLDLLGELRRELGLSLLFITHDLGVVATIADEVIVLDKGVVCEGGRTATVLTNPQHPYTQRILAAAPRVVEADAGP